MKMTSSGALAVVILIIIISFIRNVSIYYQIWQRANELNAIFLHENDNIDKIISDLKRKLKVDIDYEIS